MDEKSSIRKIKEQIRELYPDDQLDLSIIDTEELANRSLFFAITNLLPVYLMSAIRTEKQYIKAGVNIFERIDRMHTYLKVAPESWFKNRNKNVPEKRYYIDGRWQAV